MSFIPRSHCHNRPDREETPCGFGREVRLALLFMDVDQDVRNSVDGRMGTFQGLKDSVGNIRVMMKSDDEER